MFSPQVTAAVVLGALIFSVYYYFTSSPGNSHQYENRYRSPPPEYRSRTSSCSSVNSDNDCAVCQGTEEGTLRRTRCRHAFHQNCLAEWIKVGGRTCPVCRRQI